MARKSTTVADLMADMRTEEDIAARQTGSEEVIDGELNKLEQMMNDIAGVTEGEIVYWLHRANEKNKSLHGAFLKRYPRDTQYIDIFEECRDSYGGGDFVLLAKKDGIIYKKAWFPVEAPIRSATGEPPPVKPPEDPFARLSGSIEKAMVFDRAANLMDRKAPAEIPKGTDPMVTVLTTMISGMQQQNTELLKLMMTPRPEAKGGNDALMDAIKLGVSISGGKVPLEDGEGGGIMEMLKPLIPMIPQLLTMLTGKGGQPRGPVARPLPPGTPVPPRPLPGAATPPAVPAATAGVPPENPPVEDANTVILRRIVEEIKFNLTLPASPKLYEHVINYIDAYMPDLLQQAEVAPADMFANYVVTLDPAFVGHEQFFMDLHKFYMAAIAEEPEKPASPGAEGSES